MAAPLGTVTLPVFIRFDGFDHQVGTIEIDVTTEVTPQVKAAERAITHALAPCETANPDTAGAPWEDPQGSEMSRQITDLAVQQWAEIPFLRIGLLTISTRGCEHYRSSDCWADGRTADARYGADLACAPCIAAKVLAGEEPPTGPGRHANEGATFAPTLADGMEDYRRGRD